MSGEITSAPLQCEPELLGQTVVLIGGERGHRSGDHPSEPVPREPMSFSPGSNPDRLKDAAAGEVGAQHTAAFDANDSDALHNFFERPGLRRSTMYW